MGQIKNIKLHIVTDIKRYKRTHLISSHQIMAAPQARTALRKLVPLFDRVLVQRLVPETTTKGGILLPEKSVGKINEGTVIAVGAGSRDANGNVVAPTVAVGDSVLLPEYGGTKIEMADQEYMLFKESDLLGKFS